MLKYFGLKEILWGLKKFAALILAVTVALGVIGFGWGYLQNSTDTIGEAPNLYSTSRSYLFTAVPNENSQSQSADNRACATAASAMLLADFTKQYIYDHLLNDYTEDEIYQYSNTDIPRENINYSVLNDALKSSALYESSIVNFYCQVTDEEFSKKVTEYWDAYFKENIVSQIPDLESCTYVGGTTLLVTDPEADFAIEAPSAAKNAIILAIVGFVLTVCFVLVYVLFKPAIATRKNFEAYDLPVLDDACDHKGKGKRFAMDALLQQATKQGCKSVALVSSLTAKKFCAAKADLVNQLAAWDAAKEIAFTETNNIVSDYDAFAAAKANDAVVLVERKGESSHTEFYNTLALLAQHEIPVLGVILI